MSNVPYATLTETLASIRSIRYITYHYGKLHMSAIPHYSLSAIQAAAKAGRINIERRADRDRQNLNMTIDDVVNCICQIKPENFYKTIPYGGINGDVYHMRFNFYDEIADCDRTDHLYVKLSLTRTGTLVMSFKR